MPRHEYPGSIPQAGTSPWQSPARGPRPGADGQSYKDPELPESWPLLAGYSESSFPVSPGSAAIQDRLQSLVLPLLVLDLTWDLLVIRNAQNVTSKERRQPHALRFTFYVSRFTFHSDTPVAGFLRPTGLQRTPALSDI